MSKCGTLLLLAVLAGSFQVQWAQGVDNSCPDGWKAVAKGFLNSKMNEDIESAAEFVRPSSRDAWAEWTSWDVERSNQRILSFSEEVQRRAQKEKSIAKQRLEVSVFSCQALADTEGKYRVKVDPDGRSYQFLTLAHDQGSWWIEDNLYALNAEQRRVFTAYSQALDAGSWEEAKAWVARFVLPRFDAYQSEVKAFLSAGGVFADAQKQRVLDRAAEWEDMFLRAEMETKEIIIVHAEFPTAEGLSSEMVKVDGTWRILFR